MTHRRNDYGRGDRMGWGAEPENGFRGQSSDPGQFGQRYGGQGEYGGWGSGEGQGEYGGQGSWAQGQFSGQGVGGPGYGWQGYENQGYSNQDFNRQGIGWQGRQYGGSEAFGPSGGPRFRDEGQFGRRRGQDQFGGHGSASYGPMSERMGEPYERQRFGGQSGSWQQGAGQGWSGYGGGHAGRWDQNQGDWEQRSDYQSSWGQGQFGDQGMGSQHFGQQDYVGQGRPSGGRGFVYEELWFIPGPHAGRGPQGYRRSDNRIEEDICEALTHHGMLDASGIQVMVANGEVTLTGNVESRQAKRMAEDILDSVSGVKDVNNQLRVQGQNQMSQMGLGQSEEMNRLGSAGQGQHQGEMQGSSRSSTKNQRGETAKAGSPR